MRAAVLAYGSVETPSTRFRFGACQEHWARLGHELEIVGRTELPSFWTRAKSFDVLINQKGLWRRARARRLFALGIPVCFDFDDALWTRPDKPYSWWTQRRVNRRLRHWLSRADRVIVANSVLADYARRFSRCVSLVPMALDLRVWKPLDRELDATVRLGWIGSPGNLGHLEALGPVLRRVIEAFPQARLAVFCGVRPQLPVPFEFSAFAPAAEARFVAGLDVGLLPLADEAYSRGKSPIKALQYMSCGVPVVGNVFGATREILNETNSIAVATETEWQSALGGLIADPARRQALGRAGLDQVRNRFDLDATATLLLKVASAAACRLDGLPGS